MKRAREAAMRGLQACFAIAGMGLVLLSTDALAATAVGGVQFGARAGLTIGNFAGADKFFDPDDWQEYTPEARKGSRLGAALGGFATYWLSPKFGLQAELLWIQVGCKRDFDVVIEDITGRLETTAAVTYIEIPLLMKYAFSGATESSPFVCVGPSMGVRSAAEFQMTAKSEYVGSYSHTEDIEDYVKSANFSLMAGLGYTLRLERVSLSVEVRYVLGLIDIMEQTGRVEVDEDEYLLLSQAKPRTLAILVSLGGN